MRLKIDRLVALREARGWSRRELSLRCGFGPSVISKYESSTSDPSATHLAIMADLFEVSTDYLLGRSDDPRGGAITITHEFTNEELELIALYRKDGWRGLIRQGVDRVLGKSEE